MYIVSQNRGELVNLDCVKRINVRERFLYADEILLGEYKGAYRSAEVFNVLVKLLRRNEDKLVYTDPIYEMPRE